MVPSVFPNPHYSTITYHAAEEALAFCPHLDLGNFQMPEEKPTRRLYLWELSGRCLWLSASCVLGEGPSATGDDSQVESWSAGSSPSPSSSPPSSPSPPSTWLFQSDPCLECSSVSTIMPMSVWLVSCAGVNLGGMEEK